MMSIIWCYCYLLWNLKPSSCTSWLRTEHRWSHLRDLNHTQVLLHPHDRVNHADVFTVSRYFYVFLPFPFELPLNQYVFSKNILYLLKAGLTFKFKLVAITNWISSARTSVCLICMGQATRKRLALGITGHGLVMVVYMSNHRHGRLNNGLEWHIGICCWPLPKRQPFQWPADGVSDGWSHVPDRQCCLLCLFPLHLSHQP